MLVTNILEGQTIKIYECQEKVNSLNIFENCEKSQVQHPVSQKLVIRELCAHVHF